MKNKDAFGEYLLYQYKNPKNRIKEIIERDDGLIETSSFSEKYFWDYPEWNPNEKKAVKLAKGKILDIGCGAGRHALYLQKKGFDVTGIDNSIGAIKVCKLRGLKNTKLLAIENINKLNKNFFDTVLMMGNNFGLFANYKKAKNLLKKLSKITSAKAQIIAENVDPYQTKDKIHTSYHQLNKKRGRMPGQLKLRVRFKNIIGDWMDYLFVSPQEMKDIVKGTSWKVEKIISKNSSRYIAILKKY